MSKRPRAGSRDAEAGPAVGVGTGDLGVGRHPVPGIGLALLRGKEGQECSEGVQGEGLARGEEEVLPLDLEVITGAVSTDHVAGIAYHFHPQIIENKLVFHLRVLSLSGRTGLPS